MIIMIIGCQDHNLSHPYPYSINLVYARIMIVIWDIMIIPDSYLLLLQEIAVIVIANKIIGLSDVQKF